MRKSIKIIFFILGILFVALAIDTIQAKAFNNSPFFRFTEDFNGGNLYQKNKGVLVDNYIFTDGNKFTVFKWESVDLREESNKTENKEEIKKKEENVSFKKYYFTIDDTVIVLDIPNEWNYEEIMPTEEDNFKYALNLYKSSTDKKVTLYYYNNLFGVCGTGRTSEKISLDNGTEVYVGYYDGNEAWSDIALNKNIAFINHGLDKTEAKEALEFIKTVNVMTSM